MTEVKLTLFFESKKIETTTLVSALKLFNNNQSELAKAIGMNRGTLRTKLESNQDYLLKVTRTDNGVILSKIND